ncbi:MAG TPA: 50S ribosomal protein L20 [Candidatus Paceibacterota bacterium]|nr:50S ribosomal protein L20 [Candidatus Paceibacterota bacterium]
MNAAVRELGGTYSTFAGALKKANIEVDRKILATLAQKNPESFKRIYEKATK